MSSRLDGLAVLVTGAASGIGRSVALRLGADGALVGCLDRDAAGLGETVSAIDQAAALLADVAEAEAVMAAAGTMMEAYGRIDALVAVAGVEGPGRAHELDLADWDRILRVNLTGTFNSVRAVLPVMRERSEGSIVLVSSVAGTTGIPGLPAYSAAKAGVIGLARQLAVDYGPEGIRVNVLCPGTIRTPMMDRLYGAGSGMASSGGTPLTGDEIAAAAARRIPLRRIGEPEDVAAWARFLVSPESAWTTGGVFAIDGGVTAT
jgi:NAD(P)-dependent dehydrogenase (short-subunit alcohol dehydrogenase family)